MITYWPLLRRWRLGRQEGQPRCMAQTRDSDARHLRNAYCHRFQPSTPQRGQWDELLRAQHCGPRRDWRASFATRLASCGSPAFTYIHIDLWWMLLALGLLLHGYVFSMRVMARVGGSRFLSPKIKILDTECWMPTVFVICQRRNAIFQESENTQFTNLPDVFPRHR